MENISILSVLNVLPPVIHHPENYYKFQGNPESFFFLRMKEDGLFERIRRFRRTMFIASVEGDETRWHVKERRPAFVKDGITIQYKYEDEYYLAMTSCNGKISTKTIEEESRITSVSTLMPTQGSSSERKTDQVSHVGNRRLQDGGGILKSKFLPERRLRTYGKTKKSETKKSGEKKKGSEKGKIKGSEKTKSKSSEGV